MLTQGAMKIKSSLDKGTELRPAKILYPHSIPPCIVAEGGIDKLVPQSDSRCPVRRQFMHDIAEPVITARPVSLSRAQWLVLAAAFFGWMFDGLEQGILPLVGRPALQD